MLEGTINIGAMVLKILLGNTGRGGELAIFTSIIKAYGEFIPDAEINVVTCDNDTYGHIFKNSPDFDYWFTLVFKDQSKPNYMDPVSALKAYFNDTKNTYDHQEYACEFDLSPAVNSSNTGTIISNCYSRIKKKFFKLEDIPRKIFIYPTDEELRFAEDLFTKYGKELIVVSYNAKSASPIMNIGGYKDLCDAMGKHRPVAYTAQSSDLVIKNHIDLRGITFSALFAIAQNLERFVGPDTATTWLVSNMPGRLISLRGDKSYPLSNTGLVANGYRAGMDTHEIDFAGCRPPEIIDRILPLIR